MSEGFVLGYALAHKNGKPVVSTVSATERATMVNALVAVYGVAVYAWTTDADIKRLFDKAKSYGHEIIGVRIERLPVMPKEGEAR